MTLVRADDACVVYAAAATRAATMKVVLTMVVLHMLTEAKQARFLKLRAVNARNYFFTGDHQSAIGARTTEVAIVQYAAGNITTPAGVYLSEVC